MRQYNLGAKIGAYWTHLQMGATYLTPFSFAMMATTLWAVAQNQILILFPWVSFPLVFAATMVLFFVILPLFDYKIMMQARTEYAVAQNSKFKNPTRVNLIDTNAKVTLIIQRLGITDEEIANEIIRETQRWE